MAVNTPGTDITPFTSTVPTVSIPPEALNIAPAPPLAGQFGKKGTGALAIGDAIFKGVLLGHEEKAKRKAAQAQATIAAADAATESAYEKYQDALSSAGGNVSDPNAKAAYDAYVGVFNQSKQAKAQFVIPEKQTGKKTGTTGGQKDKEKHLGFGGIKDFFEANPHIVPQIALMTMQPKPQGLSQDRKLQDLQMRAAQTQVDVGTQQLQNLKTDAQEHIQDQHRAELQRQVEEAGGVDAVIADKKATPELQQAARGMKYAALDKMSPLEKTKNQLMQDVLSGANKNWTPQQRTLAGAMGIVPMPQVVQRTGKNGHEEDILVDPLTNQPIPGSRPLDLGPPQWAQEFYAKRSADKRDLQKAVESDPAAFGVQTTGNKQADKAAIDGRVEEIYISREYGIRSLATMLGKTGYEVQRDNDILNDVVKAAGLNAKSSPLDTGDVRMSYPVDTVGQDGKTIKAGTEFAVGKDYFNKILDEFTVPATEGSGVRSFRSVPINTDRKSPQVLDAERRFMYQWVKNQMTSMKGKSAMTPDQADGILRQTALGTPIIASQPTTTETATGRMTPPPGASTTQAQMKPYYVPGYADPVMMTDAEAKQARDANIPVEDASGVLQQFNQP